MPRVLMFACMSVFVSVPQERCVKERRGGAGGRGKEGVSETLLLTKERHSAEASTHQ